MWQNNSFLKRKAFLLLFCCAGSLTDCTQLLAADEEPSCDLDWFAKINARIADNRFYVARTLRNYHEDFGPEFFSDLNSLKSDELWFDSGAGLAIAGEEYLTSKDFIKYFGPTSERAYYHGLSVKRPWRFNYFAHPKFRYTESYLEQTDLELLAKPSLITDVYGPLSYSAELSEVLNIYLKILRPGGSLYLLLDDQTFIVPKLVGFQTSMLEDLPKARAKNKLQRLGEKHGLSLENWLLQELSKEMSVKRIGANKLKISKVETAVPKLPSLRALFMIDSAPPSRLFEVESQREAF